MKYRNIFLSISFLITLLISCKESIVDPEENLPAGRRDYIWDVTNLESPNGEGVWLSAIWGSSTQDIWAVGQASLSTYGIWHFNGTSWEKYHQTPGGGLSGLWGTANNNIWLGNVGGLLWHFNGSEWVFHSKLKIEGYEEFCIQKIWGLSENEIYLLGAKTYGENPVEELGIFKYDGNSWKRINIPKLAKNGFVIYKDRAGDILFLTTEYGNNKISLYSWNGITLNTIFESENQRLQLRRLGEKTVIIYGNKIYQYVNGKPELIKDYSGVQGNLGFSCCRNENDIFLGLYSGSVIKLNHFNGEDLAEIYPLPPGWYPLQGMIFENDVYIIISDLNSNKTKILHGKLKT